MIQHSCAKALALALGLVLIQCSLTIDEEELGGAHVLTCANNEKKCDVEGEPECVRLDNPLFGCARPNCIPCNLPNATAICTGEPSECVKSTCHPSWDDCNMMPEDGCEVSLNTNVEHCGACNEPCARLPHAVVACGGGHCYIKNCTKGYLDCNGEVEDGCEVDEDATDDCGDCGEACGDVCCAKGFCCNGSCGRFICDE